MPDLTRHDGDADADAHADADGAAPDDDRGAAAPAMLPSSLLPRRRDESWRHRLADPLEARSRSKGAWRQPRSDVRHPPPRGARTPPRRATWVYLLTHVHRQRYKVGYSSALPQRLAQLDAARLDPTACWAVELPNRESAQRVERSLHRFLAPYRLDGLSPADGYTEWFSIGSIAVALDLMRTVPAECADPGAPPAFAPLQRLVIDPRPEGMPNHPVDVAFGEAGWVPSAWVSTAPQEMQVQHRIGELCALVEVMATWWPLQWHPVSDPGAATASRTTAARAWRLGLAGDLLVVRGLRRLPGSDVDEVDYQAVCNRVIDADTWELLPGRPASSLVATMDYGRAEPDDLLLRLRPRAVLRRWPGAAAALPLLWRTIERVAVVRPHGEGGAAATAASPSTDTRPRRGVQ